MRKLRNKLFMFSECGLFLIILLFTLSCMVYSTHLFMASILSLGGVIMIILSGLAILLGSASDSIIFSIIPQKILLKHGFIITNDQLNTEIQLTHISTKYINHETSSNIDKVSDLKNELTKVSHCYISGILSNKFVNEVKFFDRIISSEYLIKYLNNFDDDKKLCTVDFTMLILTNTIFVVNNLNKDVALQVLTFDQNLNLINYIQNINIHKIIEIFKFHNDVSRIFENDVRTIHCGFVERENLTAYFKYWINYLPQNQQTTTTCNKELKTDKLVKDTETIIDVKYAKINDLMREVDNLLNQGFQFQSITLEKYENIYKKEILDICNFNYQLDTNTESKILNILEILKNDLRDVKEEQDKLNKDSTISALENLMKLDGLIEEKMH